MNGDLILKRDDSENPTVEFGKIAPEPESVGFLRLKADRRVNNPNAKFLRQVRPLYQHLFLEILGEPVGSD